MYKVHWFHEKFVHITSKRFVDRTDDDITVKVYSNCNAVTLYINGEVFETKTGNKIYLFENVPLKDGINQVKAVGRDGAFSYEDMAVFQKVSEPNLSYIAPDSETGGVVANWFDMPEDLEDVVVEKIEINDDVFSTRDSLSKLFANEEAKAVVKKFFGDIEEKPMFAMMEGMSFEQLAEMAPEQFDEKMLYRLNKELTKIKK